MTTTNKTGHERLNEYLDQWAETQSAFADRCGLDRHTLNHIVKERRRPTLDQAFAIEKATGGVVPASAWAHDCDTDAQG